MKQKNCFKRILSLFLVTIMAVTNVQAAIPINQDDQGLGIKNTEGNIWDIEENGYTGYRFYMVDENNEVAQNIMNLWFDMPENTSNTYWVTDGGKPFSQVFKLYEGKKTRQEDGLYDGVWAQEEIYNNQDFKNYSVLYSYVEDHLGGLIPANVNRDDNTEQVKNWLIQRSPIIQKNCDTYIQKALQIIVVCLGDAIFEDDNDEMDQKTKDVINGFFDGELTLVVEPIYITRILIDNIPFKICNPDGTCNEVIAWGTAQEIKRIERDVELLWPSCKEVKSAIGDYQFIYDDFPIMINADEILNLELEKRGLIDTGAGLHHGGISCQMLRILRGKSIID